MFGRSSCDTKGLNGLEEDRRVVSESLPELWIQQCVHFEAGRARSSLKEAASLGGTSSEKQAF